MSKKLDTIWDLDPHTTKKHDLLRNYFDAWLPIMARWNGRVVYIDGFSGPGKYSKDEDGSPLVVLKAARDHSYPLKAELACIFVEANKERCDHLKIVLEEIKPSLPANIKYGVVHGTFDEHLTRTFAVLEEQKKALAPTLVFIDPFGFSHTPFSDVAKILKNNRCEVLINFMYEEVNRFLSLDKHSDDYDKLFGTTEWRQVSALSDPKQRRAAIHDLYLRQLRTAAKYVHSFEMKNSGNSTDYFLFFATNGLKGLEKMKEAMWKVDPSGSFQFSDYQDSKLLQSLFADQPNLSPLKEMIQKQFSGETISIESLIEWVIAETPFLPKHLKRPTLAPMEAEGSLEVVKINAKRKKGTFSDGTVLKFR